MEGSKQRRRYFPVRKTPALLPANRRFARSSSADDAKVNKPNVYPGRITFTNGLAAAPPAPLPPDFLLLDAVKDDDLDLTFPLPGNTDYKDIVQLFLNGVAVDSPVLLNDFIDAGDDTIRIKLSAAARKAQPEGKVFINYKITFLSGNNEDEDGPADQFYTTDFTVPGLPFPGALVFSDEVLQNGVTPAAMQTDGDGKEYLEALVPSYSGESVPGDIIKGLIGTAEEDLDFLTDGADGFKVRFMRDFIEANEDADGDGEPDGKLSYSYIVQKRSGIRSQRAKDVILDVLLQESFNPPTPLIPAYDDDADYKLIDVADARADGGLIVTIGTDPGFKALDEIWLDWGDDEEIGPIVVSDPAANPAATVPVPYAAILDAWKAASGGIDQEQTVAVAYRVKRGKIVAGVPLVPASVKVNLHEAGGIDPKPETPENENLGTPVLTSASGSQNEIPPEDAEKAATLTVPFELVDPPGALAFKAGDKVLATYDGQPIGPTDIAADPTADLPITIPDTIIKTSGSGAKLVSFTVWRSLAAGGMSTSKSPDRTVVVHGSDELPGKGRLSAGMVPDGIRADPKDPKRLIVGKTQAIGGADFVIPPYANQNTEDTISLKMTVFRSFYDTPGHPTDRPPVDSRDVLIENQHPTSTAGPTTIHFSEEQLMRYDLPTQALHAHLEYTVVGKDTSDRPVTSEVLLIDLDPRGD